MCAKPRPRPFIGVASTQVHEADMETQPPPHIDMLRDDEGVSRFGVRRERRVGVGAKTREHPAFGLNEQLS